MTFVQFADFIPRQPRREPTVIFLSKIFFKSISIRALLVTDLPFGSALDGAPPCECCADLRLIVH